jgi:hypothetical protein
MDSQNFGTLMSDSTTKLKSFWDKPEGKVGMVAIAGGIVLGGIALFKALPFIIVLLQNAITATLLGLALFAIGYVIFNGKFQAAVWYLFQYVMRKFTSLIIELDPINILKSYLEHLKKQLFEMQKSIGKLNGQIRTLDQMIAKNESDRADSLAIAKKAKEAEKTKALILNSRRAGRLQKSNMTLQALRDKLAKLLVVLEKMNEAAEFMYADTEDEVKVKEQEYAAIQSASSAFRSALSVIKGDPDKKAMFDQTMEMMTNDFAMKIGEIEEFMKMSSGVIEGIDLQNMCYEEDALNELEGWATKADSLILPAGTTQQLALPAPSTDSILDTASKIPVRETVKANRIKAGQGNAPDMDKFFDQ